MKHYCKHCNAPLLPSEVKSRRGCRICSDGKCVTELQPRYEALHNRPVELTSLLTVPGPAKKELQQHSMEYNNQLSFGAVILEKAPYSDLPAWQQHKIVKCNNFIQHVLWDFKSPAGQPDLRGQLYTIPPAEARRRLGEITQDLAEGEHGIQLDVIFLWRNFSIF